jgi:hypothetical protein
VGAMLYHNIVRCEKLLPEFLIILPLIALNHVSNHFIADLLLKLLVTAQLINVDINNLVLAYKDGLNVLNLMIAFKVDMIEDT